jgi:hypothetical protein
MKTLPVQAFLGSSYPTRNNFDVVEGRDVDLSFNSGRVRG